ncbi:hypothetical protein GCM10020254_06060 [Streptomyces goshikiensis]
MGECWPPGAGPHGGGVDDPRPPLPLAQPLTPPQDFRGGIVTALPRLSDRHRGWAPGPTAPSPGPHGRSQGSTCNSEFGTGGWPRDSGQPDFPEYGQRRGDAR